MSINKLEEELSEADFEKLRSIIHKSTGISIASGRRTMLLSRLKSRLREIEEVNFRGYIRRVTEDPEELQQLINRVTTNKTYFYRTGRIWEHFRTKTVPTFLEKKFNRPMRIWSGASSTGEEAHTIGLFLEDVRKKNKNFDYTILGTDISSRVLEIANEGIYSEDSVKHFIENHPQIFKEYMSDTGCKRFQAQQSIRSRIKFKHHNLIHPLSNASIFDVIFLRNVLIYFSNADQEIILRNIRNSMPSDGILYIGESETLTRLNTQFQIQEPMIYTATNQLYSST